jgi:hypothetical protein
MRLFFDAKALVSADQGLLAHSAPPLPLLSPRQCWEQLRGNL